MSRRPGWFIQRRKQALKRVLWWLQDGTCAICRAGLHWQITSGPAAVTLDHIKPKSAGGGLSLSNLQLAHALCNQARGIDPHPVWVLDRHAGAA